MKSVELKKDVKVRLKTKGNRCIDPPQVYVALIFVQSVFVDTITRFDSLMPNYAGEAVGDNWGAKIVTNKADEVVEEEDNRQGVDDAEWDWTIDFIDWWKVHYKHTYLLKKEALVNPYLREDVTYVLHKNQ